MDCKSEGTEGRAWGSQVGEERRRHPRQRGPSEQRHGGDQVNFHTLAWKEEPLPIPLIWQFVPLREVGSQHFNLPPSVYAHIQLASSSWISAPLLLSSHIHADP